MSRLSIRPIGAIPVHTTRVMNRTISSGRVTIPFKPAAALTVKCTKIEKPNVKFDRWISESVEVIVKNLQEAPLFVHVYGGDETDTRLKTEKAETGEWARLKEKWVKGEEPSPEGIILVEELKEGNMGILEESEGQNGENTKIWGVLIQSKGENSGVGCYLLKTSRVNCGNLGVISTHYCLVKVKSFQESARSQLTSCWLAQMGRY